MEAVVEQIIKRRTYGTLSEEERSAVSEWCSSEEEFVRMKQFLLEVEDISSTLRTEPSQEIKNSLDSIFVSKHGGIRADWTPSQTVEATPEVKIIPLHQKTWFRAAAVAAILLGTIPLWDMTDNEVKDGPEPIAKLEAPKEAEKPSSPEVSESPVVSTAKSKSETVTTREEEQYAGQFTASDEIPEAMGKFKTISEPSFDGTSGFSFSATAPMSAGSDISLAPALSSYTVPGTVFSAGRQADLNPYGTDKDVDNIAAKSVSMAEQPEDLFDFIVPAF